MVGTEALTGDAAANVLGTDELSPDITGRSMRPTDWGAASRTQEYTPSSVAGGVAAHGAFDLVRRARTLEALTAAGKVAHARDVGPGSTDLRIRPAKRGVIEIGRAHV